MFQLKSEFPQIKVKKSKVFFKDLNFQMSDDNRTYDRKVSVLRVFI